MSARGLVVFDCDGVLVDSEGISMRELRHAIEEVGDMLSPEQVHDLFVGVSLAAIETGVLAHLGRIFSATMVANGKPSPDLFLHAAAVCGFAPADCVVVEDSVTGVTAARAAEMRTLGYTGGDDALAGRLTPLGAERLDDLCELPARLPGYGSVTDRTLCDRDSDAGRGTKRE